MPKRTVMCFGDSNTHGTMAHANLGDRGRFPPESRWPDVMASILGDDWQVIAEGHPGRTAVFDDPIEGEHKNGMRALPMLLETHRPLDLVIILLGTNDVKTRFSATAFDISKGLERLAQVILKSDAGPDGSAPKVLLAAPSAVEESGTLAPMFVGANEKSTALPALLSDVAARLGTGFVDMTRVATVDPVDGVHLTASAQQAIGQKMAQSVQDLFG